MAHPRGRDVLNPRPPVDYDAILAETLAPLAAEAFPVATWSRQAIVSNFIDVKKFVAYVKLLTKEGDPAIRGTMIDKGSTMKFWRTPGTCTVAEMFKFCAWLKSAEGTQFLNDTRRKRALERKSFKGQNFQEASFISAMEAQVFEFSMVSKKAGDEVEERLARLRREIVLTEERMERDLAAIKADHAPASAYEAMDDMELGAACFALYRAACARENKDEAELDEDLLADIKATYGNEAVARHKVEFLREGARQEELQVWVADKIVQLSEAGDRKKANRFRTYLEAMGGDVSAQVRNRRRAREGLEAVNTLDHPCRRRREPEDAGNQKQGTAGGEGRNGGTGPGPAAQQPQDDHITDDASGVGSPRPGVRFEAKPG